jgi:polysaccharide biosynthesis transport protein
MSTDKSSAPQPWLSLPSILRTLWKQKLYLVVCAALVGGIAVYVVSKLPPVYYTEATVLVESQKIPEKYVSSTVSTDVQDRLATISQQLLSSDVLLKIINEVGLYRTERKNHLQEEVVEVMRADIFIKLERGWTGNRPGAFRVGYQGSDPNVVAAVATRLANLFVDENLKTRNNQAQGTFKFIEDQLTEAKKALDGLEVQVSKFKELHNGELPEQQSILSGTLSRLDTQLQGVQEATNRAQQNKILLESTLSSAEAGETALAGALRPPETGNTESGSPAGQVAPKKSAVLQAQLELLQTHYGEDYPDIKRLRQEIARVKEIEKTEVSDGPSPVAQESKRVAAANWVPSPEAVKQLTQARERVLDIRAQLKRTNQELEARSEEQQRIRQQITEYQHHLDNVPLREQEMAGLTRDYETSKDNYKSLLDKKISASMSADMEYLQKAEKFVVIDPPRVPEKPSKPNRPLWEAVGCAFGLMFGVAVAFGKELKNNTLLGEWELPGPVVALAYIPYIQIPDSESSSGTLGRRQKLVWAILSSAVVSIVVLILVSVHFTWIRF